MGGSATGLEPAILGVTGRYSNLLNYRTALVLCWEIEANSKVTVE